MKAVSGKILFLTLIAFTGSRFAFAAWPLKDISGGGKGDGVRSFVLTEAGPHTIAHPN